MKAVHINPHSLTGWERTVATHDAVGAAVASGAVDVGPGLHATATAWNLEFIPLGDERYDLIIPRDELELHRVEQILAKLESEEFRRTAKALRGYDLSKSGRVMARLK